MKCKATFVERSISPCFSLATTTIWKENLVVYQKTLVFFFLFHTHSRTVISHFVSADSNEMTLGKKQKTFSLLAPGRFGERCSLERIPRSPSGNFSHSFKIRHQQYLWNVCFVYPVGVASYWYIYSMTRIVIGINSMHCFKNVRLLCLNQFFSRIEVSETDVILLLFFCL